MKTYLGRRRRRHRRRRGRRRRRRGRRRRCRRGRRRRRRPPRRRRHRRHRRRLRFVDSSGLRQVEFSNCLQLLNASTLGACSILQNADFRGCSALREVTGLGQCTSLDPKAMFMEEEGMTLVVPKQAAQQHGYTYDSVFKCITLTVHSSLDAVGLTAAFANTLKQNGMSANVIAGYYHDHIFVHTAKAEQALAALTSAY